MFSLAPVPKAPVILKGSPGGRNTARWWLYFNIHSGCLVQSCPPCTEEQVEAPPLLMRDLWGERPGVPLNCQEPGHPKYHQRPAALLQGIQQACDQRTLRPCRPCLGVGRGSNPSDCSEPLTLQKGLLKMAEAAPLAKLPQGHSHNSLLPKKILLNAHTKFILGFAD